MSKKKRKKNSNNRICTTITAQFPRFALRIFRGRRACQDRLSHNIGEFHDFRRFRCFWAFELSVLIFLSQWIIIYVFRIKVIYSLHVYRFGGTRSPTHDTRAVTLFGLISFRILILPELIFSKLQINYFFTKGGFGQIQGRLCQGLLWSGKVNEKNFTTLAIRQEFNYSRSG